MVHSVGAGLTVAPFEIDARHRSLRDGRVVRHIAAFALSRAVRVIGAYRLGRRSPAQTGICCEMQWKLPPPVRIAS
ncbi:MAG: hypothetical protein ABIS14_03100, partial [Sphingomonas sp.]